MAPNEPARQSEKVDTYENAIKSLTAALKENDRQGLPSISSEQTDASKVDARELSGEFGEVWTNSLSAVSKKLDGLENVSDELDWDSVHTSVWLFTEYPNDDPLIRLGLEYEAVGLRRIQSFHKPHNLGPREYLRSSSRLPVTLEVEGAQSRALDLVR